MCLIRKLRDKFFPNRKEKLGPSEMLIEAEKEGMCTKWYLEYLKVCSKESDFIVCKIIDSNEAGELTDEQVLAMMVYVAITNLKTTYPKGHIDKLRTGGVEYQLSDDNAYCPIAMIDTWLKEAVKQVIEHHLDTLFSYGAEASEIVNTITDQIMLNIGNRLPDGPTKLFVNIHNGISRGSVRPSGKNAYKSLIYNTVNDERFTVKDWYHQGD